MTHEWLKNRQDKQFLCIDFMNREEIVSRLIFLTMLLSRNNGSLKIAQIKPGNNQEKPPFLEVVKEKLFTLLLLNAEYSGKNL